MNIHLYTDLPLWSLTKNSGARSFNETINALRSLGDLCIFSSAPAADDELLSAKLVSFNPHRLSERHIVKIFAKPIFLVLNTIYIFLKLIINSRKADLVYCYEIAHAVPCWIFCSIFGKKLVLRFQGTLVNQAFLKKGASKYFFLLRHFDHVVALRLNADLIVMTDDGTQGREVLEWLGNKSPMLFLRNGVETYDLKVEPKHELSFLACSRLVRWKNVDMSIAVFAKIHQSLPESRLTIVGDGPMREELQQMAQQLRLDSAVEFVGSLTHRKTIEEMAEHRFYISCFTLSNVGNPLLECMALGLVPITLDNGTTGELVRDGENGVLSEPENYMCNAEKFIRNYRVGLRYAPSPRVWNWAQRMDCEMQELQKCLM